MNFKVLISVISLIINTVICSHEVPVLAWGTGLKSINYHVPAMKMVSPSNMLENFVKVSHKPIVVFIEETLDREDFVLLENRGEIAYPSIQKYLQSDSLIFLPSVTNPVKAFETLETQYQILSDLKNLPDELKEVIIVNLGTADNNETRDEMLRRHDKFIDETCTLVKSKYGNAVCVLTGYRKSRTESDNGIPVRHLLQTSDVRNNNISFVVIYKDDIGLIFTKQPLMLLMNDKICNLGSPKNSPTKEGALSSIAVYPSSNCSTETERVRLVINFSTDNKTWQLSSINASIANVEKIPLTTTTVLGSSIGYSYHTPATVVFESADKKTRLVFNSVQAEYFGKKKSKAEFSPADDAVTFFTIPILSGLFVTSLLVTIVLLGLSMIFDIKTMDQFDDPKGKTVTINASE